MADHARQPQPGVSGVSVPSAEAMDFFELLRRLERDGRLFGRGSRPDREPARLGQELRQGFSVRDVAALVPATERTPARVSAALFGPTPRAPGSLSEGSPLSAMKSGTWAGSTP